MNPEPQISTHWQGCWRAHHQCAVVLLDRILASARWVSECAELGCHDEDPQVGDGTFLRQAVDHLEQRQGQARYLPPPAATNPIPNDADA